MRSKKTQKRTLKRITPSQARSEKDKTERKQRKVMLLKSMKKTRNSRDQELVETYGGELVDLTDLTAWGEFDTEYEEPKGNQERNKMVKKVRADVSNVNGSEDEECSDNREDSEDEDGEEDNWELQLPSDSDSHDSMDDDRTSDDDNEDWNEQDFGEKCLDEAQSDESGIMDLDDHDKTIDKDGQNVEKLPFKGPLALKPNRRRKRKQATSPVLDRVEPDSSDGEDGLEMADGKSVQPNKPENDDDDLEDCQIELNDEERKLTREWDVFDINVRILKVLAELKYTEPTEIQSNCLTPAMRDRQDVLGAAETGSGKTLAFGIPLVHRLIQENCRNTLGALVLTPTRELAVQVKKHLSDITKYTWLHVVCVVGGLSHEKQMRLLAKGPEIIVATPGRLFELVQEDPALQKQLTSVKCLVIDEADRMIQKGHFEEMQIILKFMNANRVGKRQNLVFSATLTMDPHLPVRVVEKKKKKLGRLDQLKALIGMTKPKVIDVSKKNRTAEKLTESRIFCEKPEQKDALLYYFTQVHPGRTLVFCNSIDCVRRLKSVLEALRLKPMALHAEMHQRQRLKHLDQFTATHNSLLIATDVAARGLDIKNIEHVIHFNVSKASETYVHRSGRTARSRQNGLSVMLVDGRELPQYRKLLHALKRSEDLPAFPVQENILKVCKMRVAKARELETLQYRQNKRLKSDGWFAKCAMDADIELDEDLLKSKDWNENRKEKVKLESLKRELESLLKKRLVPLTQRIGESLKMPEKDALRTVSGAKGSIN